MAREHEPIVLPETVDHESSQGGLLRGRMPIAQLMPLPVHWPYLPAIERLSLALALGLFVGLERQWRRKEAGLRTFGLASLLGCMGGLLGPGYALMIRTYVVPLDNICPDQATET
jgi:MgtC family